MLATKSLLSAVLVFIGISAHASSNLRQSGGAVEFQEAFADRSLCGNILEASPEELTFYLGVSWEVAEEMAATCSQVLEQKIQPSVESFSVRLGGGNIE